MPTTTVTLIDPTPDELKRVNAVRDENRTRIDMLSILQHLVNRDGLTVETAVLHLATTKAMRPNEVRRMLGFAVKKGRPKVNGQPAQAKVAQDASP